MTRLKIGIQVFLPIFFATIIVVFPVVIKWFTPTRIKGVDSVAESMVNVASIDLGLFAAIIGVIVAFWDRTVFVKMRESGETQFQFFALEAMALISNFALLMGTLVVQIRANFNNSVQTVVLTTWLVLIIMAVYFTFQALLIMFKTVIYADEKKQIYIK
ncbi:hypothetical protein [Weissella cibaria]|uniref:hypothetical protein n=1 Tax=Weissella cibaria TaxID=137591 RepID=UPI000D0B4B68|nr:hypothetical protein [Weissella cibaria]AVO66735.1 hypothetical protein C6N67_06880 [Weissella cibaria]